MVTRISISAWLVTLSGAGQKTTFISPGATQSCGVASTSVALVLVSGHRALNAAACDVPAPHPPPLPSSRPTGSPSASVGMDGTPEFAVTSGHTGYGHRLWRVRLAVADAPGDGYPAAAAATTASAEIIRAPRQLFLDDDMAMADWLLPAGGGSGSGFIKGGLHKQDVQPMLTEGIETLLALACQLLSNQPRPVPRLLPPPAANMGQDGEDSEDEI
ncbi:hypothetical protein C2845_PM17G15080 [Panicum miliaceum]|uniref:Uncharacterized protein n=1 Tax=Panicum miliaceum TaxID=4540 RepID=A0A3L6Q294_PANMI|nr:hypothetical protein C2845_PM17G15080 [Panicum miliaceum]